MLFLFYLVVLGLLGGLVNRTLAQGVLHAPPYAAGLSVQPALCGVYEGQWRATSFVQQRNLVLQRSQGGGNELQKLVRAAFQLERDLELSWYRGAVGLWVDSERLPGLAIQHAQTALAYDVPLGSRARYHHLRAGFQGGLIQYQLDPSSFTFEDQFDGQSFSRPTNQQLPHESLIRFDLAMGVLFYRSQKIRGNPEFNYFIGGAMQHVNRPEIGFFATEQRQLSINSILQGGGVLRTRSPWEFLTSFVFQYQNDRSHWLGQFAARYSLHEGSSILGQRLAQFLLGVNYRPNLSATLVAGLSLRRSLRLALTYEVRTHTRDLLLNNHGGVGLILQYLWGGLSDELLNQNPFPDF